MPRRHTAVSRARRAGVIVVASLAVVAFPACGGGDESDVEDAIQEFSQAVEDGDGEKACDLLTDNAKGGVSDEECEQQFADLDEETKKEFENVDVSDVEVDGDEATAKVKPEDGEEDEAKLKKEDGDWKIDE